MSAYRETHRNRVNLLIHLVAVPAFIAGVLFAFWFLADGALLAAGIALTIPVVSMALQRMGHNLEARQPVGFTGPLDAIRRIFAEQFFRFPMFVLSGEFFVEWRRNGA